MQDGPAITFLPSGRRVIARPGETLLAAARRGGARIVTACGGQGICRACAVRIDGAAPPAGRGEAALFSAAELTAGWRRACQAVAIETCTVYVPPRTAVAAISRGQEGGAATVPIVEPLAVQGAAAAWGLAIDLGTTNIAGALIDLSSGEVLATAAKENPQGAYGADIVSRMAQVLAESERAGEMQQVVVDALNEIAEQLTSGAPERIAAAAIAGNTVMHHLLLGHPVEPLARAPYHAAATDAAEVDAAALGLRLAPGARLWSAPNVAGFVGGDHVAALLEVLADPPAGRFLLLDIGTNTEVSLLGDGAITAVSCASGPAFEGWSLTCGMRAAPGAIERVRLAHGKAVLHTIDGAPPVGICGSGVVSLVAELRRTGAADARGALAAGHPGVQGTGSARAFVLTPELAFTQDDVRAVQLAKAAIRAGIDLLLVEAGLSVGDVDRIVIAGAFGRFLAIDDLVTIGLLPEVERARVLQVGNAAAGGVRRMLACGKARRDAARLAREVRYLELAARPDFQRTFLARTAL